MFVKREDKCFELMCCTVIPVLLCCGWSHWCVHHLPQYKAVQLTPTHWCKKNGCCIGIDVSSALSGLHYWIRCNQVRAFASHRNIKVLKVMQENRTFKTDYTILGTSRTIPRMCLVKSEFSYLRSEHNGSFCQWSSLSNILKGSFESATVRGQAATIYISYKLPSCLHSLESAPLIADPSAGHS